MSINRADNKRESNRTFHLRATPSLFQSENQSQYTTQKNRKIAASKHATPPHRLPPENVKTPKKLSIFEAHPENRNKEENGKESKNERRIRSQKATDEVLILCGSWGFIIITENLPPNIITRNRGNCAFCTVIGFTVTEDYEFLVNVLHDIDKCVFSW